MSKLGELKKELRELRKTHCPPVSKLKKHDVLKEIERLKGHTPTEVEVKAVEHKPRVKKVKKEMAVQADMEEEEERESVAEKMARVRAGKKIAGAVKKVVEKKKEEKERESMAERMARVRAGKKIAGAVKKVVEKKKEKKEAEMMGMEDKDVGKPKRRKTRVSEAVEKMEEKMPPLQKRTMKMKI